MTRVLIVEDEQSLREVAGKLQTEIAKTENVGLTFITGGRPREIRIIPDPAKLSLHQVTLGAVMDVAGQANRAFPAGTVRDGGQAALVVAGQTLRDAQELSSLTVRSAGGAPVSASA